MLLQSQAWDGERSLRDKIGAGNWRRKYIVALVFGGWGKEENPLKGLGK